MRFLQFLQGLEEEYITTGYLSGTTKPAEIFTGMDRKELQQIKHNDDVRFLLDTDHEKIYWWDVLMVHDNAIVALKKDGQKINPMNMWRGQGKYNKSENKFVIKPGGLFCYRSKKEFDRDVTGDLSWVFKFIQTQGKTLQQVMEFL